MEANHHTLRLWAAAAPDYFDFQQFGTGDFVGALGETLQAESLTRVLYPDDSTLVGQRTTISAGIFWLRVSLPIWCARFSDTTRMEHAAAKVRSNSMTLIPPWQWLS